MFSLHRLAIDGICALEVFAHGNSIEQASPLINFNIFLINIQIHFNNKRWVFPNFQISEIFSLKCNFKNKFCPDITKLDKLKKI